MLYDRVTITFDLLASDSCHIWWVIGPLLSYE